MRVHVAAPSQPGCFTVAVLTRLRWHRQPQLLNTLQGPSVSTAFLVAQDNSQSGCRWLGLSVEAGVWPLLGDLL